MKRFTFSRGFRNIILVGISLVLFSFLGSESPAMPGRTNAGKQKYTKEELERNQESHLQEIKNDLRRGQVAKLGRLAPEILKISPFNKELRALYSIYLVSIGKVDEAHLELEKIGGKPKGTKYGLYALAMIKRNKERYDDAIRLCKEALDVDQNHPFAWNILGGIYVDLAEYKKALDSFKKAIEISPDFLMAYKNIGFVFLQEGDLGQSEKYFKEAIRLAPKIASSHYGLALVLEKRGNLSAAIRELERSLRIKADDNPALTKLGELQLKAGMYEEALKSGQEMERQGIDGSNELMSEAYIHLGNTSAAHKKLKQMPTGNVTRNYLSAILLLLDGKYEESLKRMKSVLDKDDDHFGAFVGKAVIRFYLGEQLIPDKDLSGEWGISSGKVLNFLAGCVYAKRLDWSKASEMWKGSEGLFKGFSTHGIRPKDLKRGLDPDGLRYIVLGIFYSINQFHQNAFEQFELGLDINPDSIWANYFVAQFYLKRGDHERSLKYLKKSIEKAPGFFAALYAMGDIELLRGRPERSIEYYEQALSIISKPALLLRLGLCFERISALEKAEAMYKTVVKDYPGYFLGFNQLAWLYAKQGIKLDRAMSMATRANELEPGNATINDTIGWIHFHKKNYDKALENLKRSNKIRPNNSTVLYHLGVVYNAMGKETLSKEYLNKALSISRDFEGAKDAMKLLGR